MANKKDENKENVSENIENIEAEEVVENVEAQESEKEEEQPKTPEELLLEAAQTVAKLNDQIKEDQDQYLRLRAEFENYRKRSAQDIDRQRVKGIELAIEAFFPSMDAIDKALSMFKDENVLKGIMLIKKQFETALNKLGVEEINPIDQEFDPEYHNAIMSEVNPDKVGLVTEVFQNGYRYKDTLLRAAMVKVATEE